MNIEEIKKEISKIRIEFKQEIKDKEFGCYDFEVMVFKILDKYNNQPDYKSAWENLKRQGFNRSSDIVAHEYLKDMQELEQKYNLGGE